VLPTSLILIEGEEVEEQDLMISLRSAKQIVIGRAPGFGHLVHVAAQTRDDLDNATREFASAPNVTGILTLAVRQ
jgi:hypothetical protein